MSGHEPEEIEEHEMNLKMLGESESEETITIKQEPRTPAPPPQEEEEEPEEEPQQMEVVTIDGKTGLIEVTLENQESETGLSQEELAQLVAATVEETEATWSGILRALDLETEAPYHEKWGHFIGKQRAPVKETKGNSGNPGT